MNNSRSALDNDEADLHFRCPNSSDIRCLIYSCCFARIRRFIVYFVKLVPFPTRLESKGIHISQNDEMRESKNGKRINEKNRKQIE